MRNLARLLVPVLSLALAGPAAAQVVKMATLAPEGSPYQLILKEMGEKWKALSGGKVELRLYPGSVAGDDQDVVRKMRLGTLGAGLITSVGVASIDKSVYALQLPMLYRSTEEVDYVLSKMGPKLEASLEAKGFIVLHWADAGWVRFFTKTPVTLPEELKSQKLFAWAGDTDAIEIWKQAGFNSIPLPSTEISTALQTGLVNALPTTPQAAVLLQWYTRAPNMTDVKWALLLGASLVTKTIWEKIPAELRPALMKAAREAGAKLRAESATAGVRDVEAMKKRGLKVIPVDAKAEAAWRQLVETAYPKIRGKVIPAEAFDEARKYLAEYRAQKGTATR